MENASPAVEAGILRGRIAIDAAGTVVPSRHRDPASRRSRGLLDDVDSSVEIAGAANCPGRRSWRSDPDADQEPESISSGGTRSSGTAFVKSLVKAITLS